MLFLLYFVNVMPNIDTQHFVIILLYFYVIFFCFSMSLHMKQKHEISCMTWVMEYVVKLRYGVCLYHCVFHKWLFKSSFLYAGMVE